MSFQFIYFMEALQIVNELSGSDLHVITLAVVKNVSKDSEVSFLVPGC